MWKLFYIIILVLLFGAIAFAITGHVETALLQKVGRKYTSLLKASPLIVKSISSCIIGSLAALTAQLIRNTKLKTSGISIKKIRANAIFGLLIPGPVLHYFLKWLHTEGPSNPILKLIIDQFAFGPVFHLTVLYLVPRLEGISHNDTKSLIRNMYLKSFLAKLKLWIPAMYLNMNYVPFEFQVLGANLTAFIWITYMSYMQASQADRIKVKSN